MNKNRYFSMLAVVALLGTAACSSDAAEGDAEMVSSDTTAIAGQDTVSVPTVVPAVDSVVTTTTVDTMQGDAVVADTVARP